jgi:hypothetical protein
VKVIPLTLQRANEVVLEWHRHNKPVVGHRFSIGAEHEGRLVGVAIVGRPVARKLDHHFTAEVNRLCTTPDAPKGTCSFLYSACRRIWSAMGGTRIITYTLERESGSSLRGAGWSPTPIGAPKGKGWQTRNREHQAVFDEPKIRWDALSTPPAESAPSA